MSKKIRIMENGPYEVDHDIPLVNAKIVVDKKGTSESWEAGKKYDTPDEPYHLCRCGRSDNKPFCDGTHTEINFDGKEVAGHKRDRKHTVVYEGKNIMLLDEEPLCGVLRFCDRGATVWAAEEEDTKNGNEALEIEEACNCATGRLTVVRKDGTVIEPKLNQEISPIQDTAAETRGPLWVKGGIEVEGADGETYEVRNRMALCCCGESNNMPFCDASHMGCPHMQGSDE